MIARRKQLIGDNAELVLRLVGIRVGKDRFAVLHQKSPATVPAADGRQHATRTTLRNGHLGSDRPRLVLEVWRRSLWDADHSREVDELAAAAGKAGPDGRIGAGREAGVGRIEVVLLRLDMEGVVQLLELVRLLRRQVVSVGELLVVVVGLLLKVF